jgi:serine/threonine-protein kinase HipA
MVIDSFPWIAKFPGRGGLVNLPYYEALAMRLAAIAGINVAEVAVETLPGDRSIFLAKRFDRKLVATGMRRFGYASAMTVLGSAGETLGPERSYIALARRMKRWVGEPRHTAAMRELWLRLSFNGMVGNADDHPRNLGFLFKDGGWRLSPAFDIVPVRFEQDRIALTMGFYRTPEGRISNDVRGQSLLAAAREFGVPAEEAKELLLSTGKVIAEKWKSVLCDLKAPEAVYGEMQGMVNWAGRIAAQVAELDHGEFPPLSKRSTRRWKRDTR